VLVKIALAAWIVRWVSRELAAYAARHWRAAGPPPIESTRAPGHMPGPEEMVQ